MGDPPKKMKDPHAHHILFKKGCEKAQQELVKEGQEILKEFNIGPILGLENLTWAPNRVKGQHGIEALQKVVDAIKAVKNNGGDRDDMIAILEELGNIAAKRR
nr:AHH domain-containing protein [Bacillus mycoides]